MQDLPQKMHVDRLVKYPENIELQRSFQYGFAASAGQKDTRQQWRVHANDPYRRQPV
jgi:hypothetical protein